MSKEFVLHLTETQAKAAIHAFDILARLGMGQLERVVDHLPAMSGWDAGGIRAELNRLHGTVLSISHKDTPEEAKVAFDLGNALQWALSNGVWGREPTPYGSEPMAAVECN